MFQISTRSLKLFPRYESAKFCKNFFVSSSSFHTLCKNLHNSCVRALILLKFCTRIGGLETNTSIEFWVNLINIEGFISDFTHKSKSNFCQACRVNCFEEKAENWYVVRLNILRVPFGGYKSIECETVEI